MTPTTTLSARRFFVFRAFSVLCIFFLSSTNTHAADLDISEAADVEKINMYQIVISPFRVPQPLTHTPQNVTVLNSQKIKNLPANDPAEALSYVSGVDITSRTRFGHFVPLSIQGSDSRHVLVMVDGIPFNTQASGQADVLSALPLHNLDRIEVVEGSASSAWGSSLGGVIHLVTKTPENSTVPKGHVTGSWAGFRSKEDDFDVSGLAGKLGYYISGEYRESGGSRTKGGTENRDDTLQKKSFGKLTYPVSDLLKGVLSYGYSGIEANEGVFPSDGTRIHVPYETRYGLLRFDLDPDERNHWEMALKTNRQLINTDTFDGIGENLLSNVRTQDNYYGSELKNVRKFRAEDTFVIGSDISEHILKTSLMSESKTILFGAPYANYTWIEGPLDVIVGGRYDLNEEFGEQFNPSLGTVYHVAEMPNTLLRMNVSRSFNAPPVLWKFFRDAAPGVTANNPDIKPERAWTYETGVESQPWKALWFKFNLFRSNIDDAINTAQNEQGFFIKKNFEKFSQQGFRFDSRLTLTKKLFLLFLANFNDVQDRRTGLAVTNRGVTRPGYRLGLEGEGACGVRFNLIGRYERWDSSASLEPNDRKFIFDGRFSRELMTVRGIEVSCFLNVYNLTNSKYWSNRDYPLPQRYFESGITLKF